MYLGCGAGTSARYIRGTGRFLDNRVSALAKCWVAFARASVRDAGTVFESVAVVVACVYCRGPVPASVD